LFFFQIFKHVQIYHLVFQVSKARASYCMSCVARKGSTLLIAKASA